MCKSTGPFELLDKKTRGNPVGSRATLELRLLVLHQMAFELEQETKIYTDRKTW